MTVSYVTSDGDDFEGSITNEPTIAGVSLTAGQCLLVGYQYRANESAVVATPTWNGQSLTPLVDRPVPATPEVRFQLFGLIASATATASIVASLNVFKVITAAYAIYSTDQTFNWPPTKYDQIGWDAWTAPNLTASAAVYGNHIVEFLGITGWDSGFGDNSASTWAPGSSQTERLEFANAGASWPKIVVADKASAGADAIQYSPSAGQPGYAHALVVLSDGAVSGIVSINDGTVQGGTAGNTLVTTDFVPVSLTIGDIAVTLTSVDADNYTVDQLLDYFQQYDVILDVNDLYNMVRVPPLKGIITNIQGDKVVFKGHQEDTAEKPEGGDSDKTVQQMAKRAMNI
jgi:hypothetical protein